MNPRHYIDLKETSRDLQPTYYFMINCLLYSRMETGLVSNQDFYDEDVNVYLAHLLHSFINPEYVEQSKKFLSRYDTDVFRRLSTSTDARLKYLIYKTNADFLLVSIGIFDNPLASAAHRAKLQPSEEAYVGRGKTYYHFAYSYSQQMHRKNAGVSDVLEKLSVGFDKYLRILSHMRGEYLDLMKRLSSGEVYHLERQVNEHSMQEMLKVKQDELLELYSAWKLEPHAREGGEPRAGGLGDPPDQSRVPLHAAEEVAPPSRAVARPSALRPGGLFVAVRERPGPGATGSRSSALPW